MKVNFKKITLSHIIYIAIFITAITIIISAWTDNNKRSHRQMVLDWREQKNSYFSSDDDTPIVEREYFSGLNYFDPDIKFHVTANLTLLHDTIPVVMLRTDGKKEQYLKHAIATFKLDKKEYQLTLFKSLNSENDDILFVPFTDNTSGDLTYKAGRYLDIELKSQEQVVIDFNYAYNPYCAYNNRYSCPIPPASNFLDTEILAGEKTFKIIEAPESAEESEL